MIKVICDACGASFKAKDEHAGKRGKCPSCGEGIQVPDVDEDDEEDDDEPAIAAPAASGGRRRAGGSRRPTAGGGGVRRPGGKRGGGTDYTAMGSILLIVTVVLVGGGWFLMQDGGGPDYLSIGIDHEAQGNLEAAKAAFEKVAPESPTYSKAQEMLAEVESQMKAEVSRLTTRRAENVYQVVKAIEKRVYRDGKGHLEVDYPNWARYMLKRADEYLKTYPDHHGAVEIKQLVYRYSDVASLDEPPTFEDVEVELSQRMILTNPNFKDSMAAIDEFAAGSPEAAEQATELRARVRSRSLEYWANIKAKIDSEGLIAAGNWQKIANNVRRYLDSVDGVPGLTEAVEARSLFDRALAGG